MKALAIANGDIAGAISFSESQGHGWRDVCEAFRAQLAAVGAEGTTDWQMPQPAALDFSEFLRPMTIIGRLVGLRRVPFRTRTIAATAGSSAYWSGEKSPRPISRMTFAGSTLEQLSVIAMLVATAELLRSSAPSAETLLSRDLANAAVQAMDAAFLDNANSGVPGVMPASITNGVTAIHSSGLTLAAIDADLALLIQALDAAGSNLQFATFVMRPRTALYLSQLRGSGGALAFPQMGVKGGVAAGLPVIVSNASPSSVGSPQEGGEITLLDPSQILIADDGGGALELSTRTTLSMSDAPTAPSTQVSMFQTFSGALKTTRFCNWQRCRAGMAQVLDRVDY